MSFNQWDFSEEEDLFNFSKIFEHIFQKSGPYSQFSQEKNQEFCSPPELEPEIFFEVLIEQGDPYYNSLISRIKAHLSSYCVKYDLKLSEDYITASIFDPRRKQKIRICRARPNSSQLRQLSPKEVTVSNTTLIPQISSDKQLTLGSINITKK